LHKAVQLNDVLIVAECAWSADNKKNERRHSYKSYMTYTSYRTYNGGGLGVMSN
jgi:hypothetical protein